MKKLVIAGMILWMAGTGLAQTNGEGTAPQEPLPVVTAEAQAQPQEPLPVVTAEASAQPQEPPMNPIARAMRKAKQRYQKASTPEEKAAMLPKSPPDEKAASLPVGVKSPAASAPAEEVHRNQLVRSLPYQPEKAASVQAASSVPAWAGVSNSSRLVVCVVNGFEQRGISAADCNAHGGRVIQTAEVLSSDPGRKGM